MIEIKVATDYPIDLSLTINIQYVLITFESLWMRVTEIRGNQRSFYLTRIMSDQGSVIEGYLYLKGESITETLRSGRVLGSYYKGIHSRNKDYEQMLQTLNKG